MYLSPAARPSTAAVLDQQVSGTDLALANIRNSSRSATSAVVDGHVVFKLVGIGSGGRFPSRDLFVRVEVVGKVLGVGVSNFPARGETSIRLQKASS